MGALWRCVWSHHRNSSPKAAGTTAPIHSRDEGRRQQGREQAREHEDGGSPFPSRVAAQVQRTCGIHAPCRQPVRQERERTGPVRPDIPAEFAHHNLPVNLDCRPEPADKTFVILSE